MNLSPQPFTTLAKGLPFTLSHPIEQAQAALYSEQYGRAMNHLLDFFEISIPYCSFVFFRLLQHATAQNTAIMPTLEQFIARIDAKRPLSLGDWVNDLFNPLLQCAQKHTPQEPLTHSTVSHLIQRKRNVLLGSKSEPSIVQIRNEYRGHSTTLSEQIYSQITQLLIPKATSMLQALQPLTLCTYNIIPGKYELTFGNGTVIDMFPFVFTNQSDFRYVFHTLKDERASYIYLCSFSHKKYDFVKSYNIMWQTAGKQFINDAHKHGKQVKIWTLNGIDAPVLPADAFITDRPDLWKKAQAERDAQH
ncbi:MAG: hypothetical protein ACI308_09410 [Muribaculaceae bacterium]